MKYRGYELDRFQADAIEALEAGDTVLVAAPTGTGKTLVADWLVEKCFAAGQQIIYTAPIKALSNQKFRDYCKLFGEEKVGLVTGDLVVRRDAPCRVMTTEILRNILLSGESIQGLAAVIVDEIHFLDDRERGTVWEEMLIYLDTGVQVLGLSATLANLDEFASWLEEVRERPVKVVEERRRAVPLSYWIAERQAGLCSPDEMARYHKRWQQKNSRAIQRLERRPRRGPQGRQRGGRVGPPTRHTDVFGLLAGEHLPYLYFVFSRRDAESLARGLHQHLRHPLLDGFEREQVDDEIRAFLKQPGTDVALDRELRELYRAGVAFHHAGLHVLLKSLVERLYEKRLIKVLYCTGTFALGINMPARAAVFDQLSRYDGRKMIPLPVREFFQMAGRAGRRGMDEEGMVVVRSNIDDYAEVGPQVEAYLKGGYEPVHSRFSLSFNSVVNLLMRHPTDHIRSIVELSFLAYHRRESMKRLEQRAGQVQDELQRGGWSGKGAPPRKLKSRVHKLGKLRQRIQGGDDRTWEEFFAKVQFLERWGYLDTDAGVFNAAAKVLMHIQIQEVFTTELFMEGVFEEVGLQELFGVLTGMCAELPRGATVLGGREHRHLAKRIERVRNSEIVREAEELSAIDVTWDPQLIALGAWWARGDSLGDIMERVTCSTDISGTMVGAFRRAKDLAGQLRMAWSHDEGKQAALRELVRSVGRDEVEVVD